MERAETTEAAAMKLLFVEMGVGYDQHGQVLFPSFPSFFLAILQKTNISKKTSSLMLSLSNRQDITVAAMRACKDAISSNSIPAFRRGMRLGIWVCGVISCGFGFDQFCGMNFGGLGSIEKRYWIWDFEFSSFACWISEEVWGSLGWVVWNFESWLNFLMIGFWGMPREMGLLMLGFTNLLEFARWRGVVPFRCRWSVVWLVLKLLLLLFFWMVESMLLDCWVLFGIAN